MRTVTLNRLQRAFERVEAAVESGSVGLDLADLERLIAYEVRLSILGRLR